MVIETTKVVNAEMSSTRARLSDECQHVGLASTMSTTFHNTSTASASLAGRMK